MFKELSHFTGLRCIEAACRHQSYSKAADELSVSQAAVSQQLRLMEEQLGLRLFYRQGRNMLPTAQAEKLADALHQGFEVISNGIRSIQCEPIEGTLTLTTTQSFASMVLMPRLWKFSQLHPEVTIRVVASPDNENLQQGDVDVAIRYGFGDFPGLEHVTILEDKVVPLCSPNLAREVDLSDPDNLRHCMLIDYAYFSYWQEWFELTGIPFNKSRYKWLEVSNQDMALSAVMASNGICFGSPKQARHYLDNGMLVQPFEQGLRSGVRYSLLYQKTSSKYQRIKLFGDWLVSELKQI